MNKFCDVSWPLPAQETITRECLSAIINLRTDVPADRYEGCSSAAKDVRLAHYVNNSIKEYDIRRDYFNDVQFCFCFLDHRCNGAGSLNFSWKILTIGLLSFVGVKMFLL